MLVEFVSAFSCSVYQLSRGLQALMLGGCWPARLFLPTLDDTAIHRGLTIQTATPPFFYAVFFFCQFQKVLKYQICQHAMRLE